MALSDKQHNTDALITGHVQPLCASHHFDIAALRYLFLGNQNQLIINSHAKRQTKSDTEISENDNISKCRKRW